MGNDAENGVNGGQGTPATPPSSTTPPTVTPPAGGTPPAGSGGSGDEGEGRVVPYKRFKDAIDELNALKAERAAKSISNGDAGGNGGTPPASTTTPPGQQPDVQANVRELAPHLKQEGFVTQEDLQIQARVSEAKEMAKTHDGSDGLPAFDVDAVTAFMKNKGITKLSYDEAYRLLHHDAIVAQAVAGATNANAGQPGGNGGKGAFGDAPKKGAVTLTGIQSMPLSEYKKMGGSKGLRDAVLSGQVTE